ncbi:FMN-binding negative transcriptional regulator [Deinococcus antarcticus]|uniref:FMN-binding negative transcriptional regulator n=1 Tax=Deinococcus antarcticus TaxID=1298767 RepID=A0ABV8A886_9DEIO
MYLPAYFRMDDHTEQLRFMRENPFATLVTAPDGVPYATHLPILIQPENDRLYLRSHLARANRQWQHFGAQHAGNREVLVIFQGPHALIRSTWYDSSPTVPTWNYTAIHAYGLPRIVEGDKTHDIAYGLVKEFVPDMAPIPHDFEQRQFKALVTFEIEVTRLEGKYKLSQNRNAQDQANVREHLSRSERQEERQTAKYMARLNNAPRD